jgi:hypothetical protein
VAVGNWHQDARTHCVDQLPAVVYVRHQDAQVGGREWRDGRQFDMLHLVVVERGQFAEEELVTLPRHDRKVAVVAHHLETQLAVEGGRALHVATDDLGDKLFG